MALPELFYDLEKRLTPCNLSVTDHTLFDGTSLRKRCHFSSLEHPNASQENISSATDLTGMTGLIVHRKLAPAFEINERGSRRKILRRSFTNSPIAFEVLDCYSVCVIAAVAAFPVCVLGSRAAAFLR
jgi:hypothetical protein